MDRKKLSKLVLFLIFLIFLLHQLASKFHLYSSVWYFDMVLHFMGGFWLSSAAIWIFKSENSLERNTILKAMLCVLVIGIFWELFEIIFQNHVAKNSFNLIDTISDICFDLSGGFAALLYFSNRSQIMSSEENKL